MYCQVCGTQLPSEARACPRCGTPAPASSPNASASSYEPTMPAASASSPAAISAPPLPPTQYGANPSEGAVPSPYSASPYEAPPPPPSRRPGKRTGLIVGIVILVLLLIGGGVFAWLRLSAANATFTVNGTFTILNTTTTSTQQEGQNTISIYTQQGVLNGDLSGSYMTEGTSTLHPDNTSTSSGTITCACTVMGKSGTLIWSFTVTGAADGSFQGQTFDFHGTGDLANLHGQGNGTIQGQGNHGTYSGQMSFGG